jgi:hypothetical protein
VQKIKVVAGKTKAAGAGVPGMPQPLCFRGVGREGTQRVFSFFPEENNHPVFVFDYNA